MKHICTALIIITLLIACNNNTGSNNTNNERLELVPELDKAERLRYEAIDKLKASGCVLTDPDTSVAGIILRSSESAIAVIGNKDKPDSLDQYHYYSTNERETLTLTQHAGDGMHNISIFNIAKAGKKTQGYRVLNIDTFKTEKGIATGMSKKEVIEKLGSCYAPLDSMNGYIELYYLLQEPHDSKTNLLGNNNMPVYYASYKFTNDILYEFEFGFEYP